MSDLTASITSAVQAGNLLESSAANLLGLLQGTPSPLMLASIRELVEGGHWKELDNRFFRTLAFGTGGLRGKTIGLTVTQAEQGASGPLGEPEFPCVGTNAMNDYNISRATQGLVAYVKKHFAATGRPGKPSLCISHDTRFYSRAFAELAAKVMVENGCDAYLFEGPRSTPELSFAVRHTKSQAGINITASHNPPEYNGYKVYWETGAQVIPPHDKAIIAKYNALTRYEDLKTVDYKTGLAKGLIQEIGDELDKPYFAKVDQLSLRKEGRENFKIVYTPLHGSGLFPVTDSLRRFGFKNVLVVPEQREPDGNFPTVKYPNPEEPEALHLALELAKKEKADLVLGTDPDSDRIGIIVREKDQFTFFNGNQIGCLLVDFFLSGMKDAGRMPKSPVVIKTIVTTDLQADLAAEYGAACEETLTGFKWICGLIEDYESGARKPYKQYVCGGEESYGFLADSFVRDKDAVSACCIAAEMVAYYKSKGLTCTEVLEQIFQRHGLYQESLFTITLPGRDGAEAIKHMMDGLRSAPPKAIDGIAVKNLRDFATSQDLALTTNGLNPAGTLTLPKSDVLQFILADGTKVSVRPSGTEPKIKFYVSVKDPSAKGATAERVRTLQKSAIERLKRIEHEFVKLAKA